MPAPTAGREVGSPGPVPILRRPATAPPPGLLRVRAPAVMIGMNQDAADPRTSVTRVRGDPCDHADGPFLSSNASLQTGAVLAHRGLPEEHFNVGTIVAGLSREIIGGRDPLRVRVEDLQQGINV